MHGRRQSGRATTARQPLSGKGEFKWIRTQTAEFLGNGERQISLFVQLAEILPWEFIVAVILCGTLPESLGQAGRPFHESSRSLGFRIIHLRFRFSVVERLTAVVIFGENTMECDAFR